MKTMYNEFDMYRIAEAIALSKEPSVYMVGETKVAGFMLSRTDLEDIFRKNHYSLDRRKWRIVIDSWKRDLALVPNEVMDVNSKADWKVIFGLLTKDQHYQLRRFAELNDCAYYPKYPEGRTSE